MRFSDEQDAVLKKIAAACDVSEVTVARWAVEALGDYWNHHGNRLLLPLRFQETFTVVTLPVEKKNLVLTERVRPENSARPSPAHKAVR